MKNAKPRMWIWTFVVVELVGLSVDAFWHFLLEPEFEGESVREMARHLATVHLLLYLGVLGLLASTTWALIGRARQSGVGLALPVMVGGAAIQTAGEVWHAYSHLHLRPNPAPEVIGFLGLAAVIAALLLSHGKVEAPSHESAPHHAPPGGI